MSKNLNTYFLAALIGVLPSLSSAESEWVQSIFQEEDNNYYVAIGGGGANQNTDGWTSHNADIFSSFGFTDITVHSPEDDSDFVGVGMAAIGYAFPGAPLRLEVAYNYIGNGKYTWDELVKSSLPPLTENQSFVADASVQTSTVMLNGFLDFIINDQWVPYVMVGGGWGLNSTKFNYTFMDRVAGVPVSHEEKSSSNNTSNFVWNVGFGVNYAFNDSVSLGAQVAYVNLGEAEFNAVPFSVNDNDTDETFLNVDNLNAVTGTINLAYHF